ncbi:D-glycerate dehydrogenase [Candidatus Nomurabacteria bacterium RIFCSPLOWO2_02_FULL_44_12]|uniref:D-glycerate dehydrogenase n=1 Tax=Candidatus Nomurabacteria bacterium RIFCSPLOWO2_12_FULL_44_11 TaxID=1801796 RepID=A0A1F6Y5K7_9BACT|nr:MAG: D-glycerate dehydrogenase [Candidatus Nomurabacteria bacterium RIFCSPHIGHO2_12_FULL_44_22b]OGJ01605.1 MAG: D-glycerate dehydrogenase [Candidatus Nomurabacteria bacterium RIFCSPLOWO2_12_FULL_44_11]OGJ08224.1 MAG: D-glycerate dehydrogenase [Candidatus Nomurabacteria bacterium RIFCSPLOWO2_02_FULL_44_12]
MKSIFITRQIPENGIKILKEKGYDVTVGKYKTPPTQPELIEELKKKNYDVVVPLLTDKIDSAVFDAVPTVKIFANYSVGFDNIDLEEATKRNIAVTNTPGDYVDGVAEHAVALLLAIMARLAEADQFVRAGKYQGWDPMLFMGDKLNGKTVAVIGTGRIGERFARKLSSGFGVKIIYYDVVRNERIEKECGAQFVSSVNEALALADAVSIHVPLLPTTHHLINKNNLAKMKPTAYLINTSRGPVVDEEALVKALQNGRIRGAGLDVFEFEPKLTKGLVKLSNTVLSPHIASSQLESREEMAEIVANNIIDFFEGRVPRNKVNK